MEGREMKQFLKWKLKGESLSLATLLKSLQETCGRRWSTVVLEVTRRASLFGNEKRIGACAVTVAAVTMAIVVVVVVGK
ncbi:hypothetical protein NL676_019690 [Syzygium grande]|nr:hypothetical protein NL676_019690 [Syzygium grande]